MSVLNSQDTRKYIFQYFAVFVATLSMLADGMQFGWTSPGVPKLLSNETTVLMTKDECKWVTQCYIMGNAAGVLLSIVIFNKISRKMAIFISCVPILMGWIGNLVSRSLIILLTSRFIAGVGRNMVYVAVPMYIGEIADPKIRGVLGNFMYLMMNTGVLIVYSLVPFVSLNISSSVGVVVACITIILVTTIPESPYYLLMQNKREGAQKSLQNLRNTENVEEELEILSATIKRQTEDKKEFSKLFTIRSNRKALLILLMLRFAQMFSGVSVMTMHVHMIFKEAGGDLSTEVSAIVYAVLMLCSCFVSMGVTDRFKRKPLMVFSCAVVAAILGTQGVFFFLKTVVGWNNGMISWLSLINTGLFVFSYRVGLGTIPIVMVSELFPANVKVYGVVLSDLMYSVSSFTSNAIFQFTEDVWGMYVPFWIFSGVCVIAAIFSQLVLPETKGRTLEEIQLILMNKSKPKGSGREVVEKEQAKQKSMEHFEEMSL